MQNDRETAGQHVGFEPLMGAEPATVPPSVAIELRVTPRPSDAPAYAMVFWNCPTSW